MTVPSDLHYGMFIPTIMSQGSIEQQTEWLPLALPFNIFGTYAQTELGHGTNISGIETTATYDKKTKEFIIHSPTITSTKWWPGGLGKTSTHCILMARLIIDEKDYGIHGFFVQLRSLEDHKPLPGIIIGDIGPKMGYEAIDNGYLRFNQYRIPLFNLLSKYSKVTEEGEYIKPPHDKLSYGTMIYVRSVIVCQASDKLSRAITIAIRYSSIRKQGYLIGSDKVGKEMTVLDFKLQQARLFPILSEAFALHFTGNFMKEFYLKVTSGIQAGDFNQLNEIHATSAALKAYSTWIVSSGIEECRKACGGHGYLKVSGLVHLYADYVPACTYEGDNYVLIQQTAKFLFKICDSIKNNSFQSNNSVNYLIEDEFDSLSNLNYLDSKIQLKLLRLRAKFLVWETYNQYNSLIQSGLSSDNAWNSIQPLFPRMINSHCILYISTCFVHGIYDNIQNSSEYSSLFSILKVLSDFYILNKIDVDMIDFVECNLISKNDFAKIRNIKLDLLHSIRNDAVPLVDAFNHSDHRLNSALGRFDGNVYEALLESTKNEPLNHTPVPDGYENFIKPLITSKL